MRAFNLIRSDPHYRRDAVDAGLRAAGYDILDERRIGTPQPSDVLVIWNRYAHYDVMAKRFEAVGAATIICENGLIGKSENAYAKQFTSDSQDPDTQLYTLSLNYHNGAGLWWIGERGRWRQQGIEVKPWRKDGEHIVLLEQRGFGPKAVAPPAGWAEKTQQRLRSMTRRPVRIRPHPGNNQAVRALETDLEGAWCAVTHGSGAGIKALAWGYPVFSDFGSWIGAPACRPLSGGFIERPLDDDRARERMLDRLAWLQWTVVEMANGVPFQHLLRLHKERAAA